MRPPLQKDLFKVGDVEKLPRAFVFFEVVLGLNATLIQTQPRDVSCCEWLDVTNFYRFRQTMGSQVDPVG